MRKVWDGKNSEILRDNKAWNTYSMILFLCLGKKRGDHVIPLLKTISWFPTANQVKFKLLSWHSSPCAIWTLPTSPASSPINQPLSPGFHLWLRCSPPSLPLGLKPQRASESPGSLVKNTVSPANRISDLGLRWDPKISTSNKLLCDTAAALPGTTLWQPLPFQWYDSTSSPVYRPTNHVSLPGTESLV